MLLVRIKKFYVKLINIAFLLVKCCHSRQKLPPFPPSEEKGDRSSPLVIQKTRLAVGKFVFLFSSYHLDSLEENVGSETRSERCNHPN